MFKKFKKLGIIMLSLTLLLSMSACKPKTKDDTASTNADGDFSGMTLKIGIWGGNEAEETSLNKLIANFEEQTGAKIDKKVYTDYNTQIQADLIGKTAPDVFYCDSSMYPFLYQTGALMEMDKEKFEADQFYESLIETFSTDGTLYAVPKDFSTLALYLNTKMFEEAGVAVEDMPGSFEELIEWIPAFQKKLDAVYGDGKVHAMSYNPEMARNMHLAQRGGLSITDEKGLAQLEDPKIVENLSILYDIKKGNPDAFVAPKDIGTGWNGEAFGVGKIAIMDEGNWVYQELIQNYSDIEFITKEMPLYKGEKGSMMYVVGWAKYAGTKVSDLADAWVQYVTGVDGMTIWSKDTGTLPSRPAVASALDVDNDAVLKNHLISWEYATPWQKGITIITIENAYKNYVTDALAGKTTLEEAMKKTDADANSEIEASLS